MVQIPNYRFEALLGEGAQTLVYKGHYIHVPHRKLVIKVLKSDLVSQNQKRYFLQKIEHLKILKDENLIVPLSYQEILNIKFITREYDPGMTLTEWMKTTSNLMDCLNIAVQMANYLEKIHQAGIIHGGIKPNNILIDPKTLKVKLVDFITPFDVRNVSHFIYDPDFIRNTLAYTSPEQTGRINHRVEFTTDIYSLGVILYELLAKTLPFESSDPLNMIHAHLAEEVDFDPLLQAGAPDILGRIIGKMLSKQPEKRYQRGSGLLADLTKTCKILDSKNRNQSFPLGLEDRSHRVTFISKMVGRDREADDILSEYDAVTKGDFRSMLISGLSGIGKTRLIQELQKPIIKNKGYFTSGKFDVYQKNVPYSSLVQAFRNLMRTYLTESDERVLEWNNKIQKVVGQNGSLLTDLIPELSLLIGPQPAVPQISPVESRNRFNYVFGNFLGCLATKENPLVLFIDDLQWCDHASFEFLTNIMNAPLEHKYLLLLGAYRHNEVDQSHPLVKMISVAHQNQRSLKEIRIGPILPENTHEMVSYILDEPLSLTEELGKFLHSLTEGNPLFVSESLSYLYNEHLLFFNSDKKQWHWDMNKIRQSNMPSTVVGLFSSKIQQLPVETVELLKFCACLGNLFTPEDLTLCKEIRLSEMFETLKPVLGQGLLIENKDQLQFIHDKVQEATLLLIDDEKRRQIHWQIGNHLRQAIPADANLEKLENIFTICSHLNIASKLAKMAHIPIGDDETIVLCKLNFSAGNSALNSLATESANEYFNLCKNLLSETSWKTHYELSYKVHQKLAKTELMMGRYESSEKLINELMLNSESDLDKAEALAEQTSSLSSIGNFINAIEVANRGLSYFKKAIPTDSGVAKNMCQVLHEKIHAKKRNVWREILNMPFTEDRASKIELAFYSELIPDLYMSGFVDQLYLSAAQSTEHCLAGGMDESVIYSFSIMGLNLGEQEQFELAFKYEDLAKELCEKYPNTFGATRGMNGVVWCNMHSRSRPNEIADYCLKSIQSGKNCGDLYNAGLSYGPLVWNLQVQGANFKEIERYSVECLEFSKKFQLSFSEGLAEAMLEGWVKPMKGELRERSIEGKIKIWAKANHIASIGSYYVHLALSSYYFGRYEEAEIYIERVRTYLHGLTDNVLKRQWYVLQVLNKIKLHDILSQQLSLEDVLKQISPILEKLEKWAHLGPLLRPYLYFAMAEKRRMEAGIEGAWPEYFRALNEAQLMNYTYFEGFIYESLASYLKDKNKSLTKAFIENSKTLYEKCGAQGKIYSLYESFSHFLPKSDEELSSNGRSESSIQSFNQNAESDIDDIYFIRASQSISAGLDTNTLLTRSIEVFTEFTGAQLGVLGLIQNDEFTKCAEYSEKYIHYFDDFSKFSSQLKSPSSSSIIRSSSNIVKFLRYVQRTKEVVLFNNQNEPEIYKSLIEDQNIRAMLCLPILKGDFVLGVIYLESRISNSVFTSKEVEMLKLLSSQTAISLDNVRLFEEVQRENQNRKRVEQELLLAKEGADNANASKSLFLANMSHEIRTPLHSIIGVTDCLVDTELTESQLKLIKMARTSGENLLSIINDILDISRIESWGMRMENISFSIFEELQNCLETLSFWAKEKGLELDVQLSPDVDVFRLGDPTRVRQIILNLVSNAIKFSVRGRIAIQVSNIKDAQSATNLQIQVKDQGIGISPENIAIIFDQFRQADDSVTRRFGGSGLGLAISKKIIELMGGKVWVESELGVGSIFYFTIYLPIDSNRKNLEKLPLTDLNLRPEKTSSATLSQQNLFSILFADDSPENRIILTGYLSKLPYKVVSVENGEEALQAFRSKKFDLVIMDIQMPVMDGLTATKQIRIWEQENHKRPVPIVAFTANAFEDDTMNSKLAGCNEHLVKPLRKDKLLAIIEKYRLNQLRESLKSPLRE